MPQTRKLAAIMFTDIKDFTKRMNASESLGMRLMQKHNEIMDGAIQRHQGVLVKNIGDAYLVDFGSAVNAVEAAVDAQGLFAEINKDASADEEILVRISIHLGDVVVQGSDVFGDGVNVASRLQSITPAGGICISRDVYTHVKSRMEAACVSIGSFALKGVTEPVDVYQVLTTLVPGPIVPPAHAPGGEKQAAPDASIAVLPFSNWSDDKETEYFSDGITEDIITDLAKISSLRVTSRNSVFFYKGKTVEMKKVGTEMNVRYVLEGSVRKAGSRLRITAQLIEAESNAHVWAERWDRDMADVFAIQDEIARHIAGELRVRLTKDQENAIENKGTRSVPAYDEYLKGLFYSRKRTKADLDRAVEHLQAALSVDPDFAQAHSTLAWTLRLQYADGFRREPSVIEETRMHAERALSLDPQLPDALLMEGLILREESRLKEAIQTLEELVERYPSHAQGHGYLGTALREVGYFAGAFQHHTRAHELDPKDFMHPINLCMDITANGNVRDLDAMIAKCTALAPSFRAVLFLQSQSAALRGDTAGADFFMEAIEKASPGHAHSYGLRAVHFVYTGRHEEAYKELLSFIEHAGDAPIVPSWSIPSFVAMGKFDEASALIERTLKGSATRFHAGLDTRSLAFYYQGAIRRSRGDPEGARESFLGARASLEKGLEAFPESVTLRSWFALLLALCGEGSRAAAEADAVQRENPGYVQFAYTRSLTCAALHDKDGLLSWLRKLKEQGSIIWWGLKNDIGLAEYANDPDFLEVIGEPAAPVSIP
ncbi:MAG: adenylate/guanylate cyclase domain-containing protein [Spirochaetia bacterium]|jgi:adenylate cyclase